MSKWFSISIRAQLFLIVFIVALPAVGIIIYSGLEQRQEALNEARTETRKLADNIASEQQNLVNATQQLLSALAQLPDVKNHNAANVQSLLGDILRFNPQYRNIYVTDLDGTMWASSVPSKTVISVSDRRYFKNALATGQFSSGEFIVGKQFSKPTLNFGYPFKNQRGDLAGVIAVSVDMEHFRKLLERSKLPPRSGHMLIDHKGVILGGGLNPLAYIGRQDNRDLFARMEKGPDSDTFVATGIDGARRFISYRKLYLASEQTPYLYVRGAIPVDAAISKADKALFQNLSLLSPFLLFALMLAFLIGKRSIIDRVAALQAASLRFATGDLQVRVADLVVGGELGSLGRSFDEMARQLGERENARLEAESEKSRLQQQLNQSQKMESIGRLAGGIAHDFNNLLTPIIGYAELLQREYPQHSQASQKVDRILQASEKAKALVQQLLSFGRKQILDMKTIDLNVVLSSFYEILRRTIRENVDIRLHLTESIFGIRADKNQLEQIIMNLAVNAQDAIDGAGVITFETTPVVLDEEYANLHPEVKPGRYLIMAVTDSGSGMDRETLGQIFEPFFTTKGEGKGSGLGLATVYGLVKQHGGTIWVYSEPGAGTVFKIYFPIVEDTIINEQATTQDIRALEAGNCTILLVEDSGMVRDMVKDLLESYGFNVLVAEGPIQALNLADGRRVDLLVTDVVMPNMNGPEIHKRLSKLYPSLKVLYMSGYTNNLIIEHGVADESSSFIQKPFMINDFINKIMMILTSPSGSVG